jgi:hypothetical protein
MTAEKIQKIAIDFQDSLSKHEAGYEELIEFQEMLTRVVRKAEQEQAVLSAIGFLVDFGMLDKKEVADFINSKQRKMEMENPND